VKESLIKQRSEVFPVAWNREADVKLQKRRLLDEAIDALSNSRANI